MKTIGRNTLVVIFFWTVILGLMASVSSRRSFASEGVPLRGFADLNLQYDDQVKSTHFAMGALDLFLAKPIDPKVSFLSEVVAETRDTGDIGVDVERLFVQYAVDPWFKVSMGRVHTALGYWNETFHHGTYLATTITRPNMLRFEDDKGILPVHTVGFEFRGNGLFQGGNLGYIADVGNGRGIKADPPQNIGDADHGKSMSLVGYFEFPGGLRFGPTLYYDTLPGDSSSGVLVNKGKEFIYGGHIVYSTSQFEFISEGLKIKHTYSSGEKAGEITAAYFQGGYHIESLTPYARYEIIAFSSYDSYLDQGKTHHFYTLGGRYELSPASAAKLEYQLKNPENESTITANWCFSW